MSRTKQILGVAAFIVGYIAIKGTFATFKATMKAENQSTSTVAMEHVTSVKKTTLPNVFFDGTGELKLPTGWESLSQGHLPKQVLFRATNPSQNADLIVMRVPQLAKLSEDELSVMGDEMAARVATTSHIPNPQINATQVTKVNGYAATQFEITGTPSKKYSINNQPLQGEVTLLLTIVSTKNSVYSIVAGAPSQDYQKHQTAIKQTIQGFSEYGTAAVKK